jgi:uncharacterized membrane protein YcaP (DUF421 family)
VDYSLLWKAVIIVIGGTLVLRYAGRKSISQMTLAQVVIMIGIGSLLVQPLVGKNVWSTLVVGLALVTTLVVIEYGQLKFDFLENFISGKSKIVIENGVLNEKNLKKIRLTVDQLEMHLRQSNVSKISDVQYATIEASGKLGFILKSNKQTATKEDIDNLRTEIQQLKQELKLAFTKEIYTEASPLTNQTIQGTSNKNSLFEEVTNKKHQQQPPKFLQ